MKRKLYCLILIISSLQVNSQVSGFLGKRFIISYTPELTYSLINPNNQGNFMLGVKFNPFAFNIKHNATAEYVITRNLALGADFMYWKTKFLLKGNFNYPDPDISGGFHQYSGIYDQMGSISTLGYGLYLKIFKRNLAPLGSYVKIKAMLLSYSPSATDTNFSFMNKDELKYIEPGKKSYQSVFLSLTFGRQRIIKKFLVIDLGIELGAALCSGLTKIGKDFSYNNSNAATAPDYLKYTCGSRIFEGMLINFNIGVGLLAF